MKDCHTDDQVNKYNFNAYDTVIALILTQYLKTRDYKEELGNVISGKHVSAPALAKLLDRAAMWASTSIKQSDDYMTENVVGAVKIALEDFSGDRYVHVMDGGFAEFLDDFLNGHLG